MPCGEDSHSHTFLDFSLSDRPEGLDLNNSWNCQFDHVHKHSSGEYRRALNNQDGYIAGLEIKRCMTQ